MQVVVLFADVALRVCMCVCVCVCGGGGYKKNYVNQLLSANQITVLFVSLNKVAGDQTFYVYLLHRQTELQNSQ